MDNFTQALLSLPLFNGKKRAFSPVVLILLRALCFLLILALIAGAVYSALEIKTDIPYTGFTLEVTPSVKYKVNLKENSFFESDTMDMDKNYIRSLVDSIDIDFSDACRTTGDGDVIVKYDVTGEVSTWFVEGGDEKVLWSQTEVITQTDFMALSSTDSTITIPVSIDQNIYAQLTDDFQNELGVSANAYYDITCKADFRCESNGKSKAESVPTVISIPLNGKVFVVNTSVSEEPIKVPFEEVYTQVKEPNWVFFAILILLALVAIFALILLCLCCEQEKKDKYIEELKAKIASVEDRIAYIRGGFDTVDEDIELKDFDSIIRLADERALPIFCDRDDVERNAVFFVTENLQRFYYTFSDKDVVLEDDLEESEQEESIEE